MSWENRLLDKDRKWIFLVKILRKGLQKKTKSSKTTKKQTIASNVSFFTPNQQQGEDNQPIRESQGN